MSISREGVKRHWDVFVAWVDGATVEFFSPSKNEWVKCRRPIFSPNGKYRVASNRK